jgi:hypothetical protein
MLTYINPSPAREGIDMTRRLLPGLLCVALNVVPAVAQTPCLTLSEGLRCANEVDYSTVSDVMRSADPAHSADGASARTSVNCSGRGSVFIHTVSGCQ